MSILGAARILSLWLDCTHDAIFSVLLPMTALKSATKVKFTTDIRQSLASTSANMEAVSTAIDACSFT